MSRYIEIAHRTPAVAGLLADAVLAPRRSPEDGPALLGSGSTFVVKLRNLGSRSWENQTEIVANNALEAAEWAAGERLIRSGGDRSRLRARVWETPFGSSPDTHFYVAS